MNYNWLNKRYYLLFAIYFSIVLGCTILYHFDPATNSQIYPPSLSREIGGFYCAGCGTLRALHQLLRGNIGVAFWLNPLLFVCLPYLLYWFIAYSLDFFLAWKLPLIKWQTKEIIGLSIVVITYSLLRNLNLDYLAFLRP